MFAGLDRLGQRMIRAHIEVDRDEMHIIADVCCNEYDISPLQFRGSSREAILADARKTFYYLCRKDLYTITCKRLGMYTGRTHSSVVHAVKQTQSLLEVDLDFRVKHNKIRDKAKEALSRNGYAYQSGSLTINL